MNRVRGWCPSAHRPMASGDGLLVRVNPRHGWLSASNALAIGDLAEQFGNGLIDLTSRANIQLRGVTEEKHPELLEALVEAGLVNADPKLEARRNVVIGSSLIADGPGETLAVAIEARLAALPDLPPKVGVAINLGRTLWDDVPGDFRFESSLQGLLLRADGAELGQAVTIETAVDALLEIMGWFLETGGAESGRMARHIARVPLPDRFQATLPKPTRKKPLPGMVPGGAVVGVPFGAMCASDLRKLVTETGVSRMGVTPWRLLRLDGAETIDVPGFLMAVDPLLNASACPGLPACAQAEMPTRSLARQLAARVDGSLHVSGCSKGCARQTSAKVTLVGRDGRFDLVQNGRPGDTPKQRGMTASQLMDLF